MAWSDSRLGASGQKADRSWRFCSKYPVRQSRNPVCLQSTEDREQAGLSTIGNWTKDINAPFPARRGASSREVTPLGSTLVQAKSTDLQIGNRNAVAPLSSPPSSFSSLQSRRAVHPPEQVRQAQRRGYPYALVLFGAQPKSLLIRPRRTRGW
ncbi:hypothetical protein BOTBODRAFT_197450 [Botryobasidium botryosum FD-172 SS1]|uniref:Uncharacterized protein n=1 Tax=Botryobasidium botryosum (strain FD-172 SS1) TaxID=930990 RepID=A0A067N2U5_BOTB1|nr:hypothetical protein BOTBODRAFT_197450 [Botryobasidium botryosum FD-172 SS1]